MAARQQLAQHMLAYEARATGEQNLHRGFLSAIPARSTDRSESARRRNVVLIFQAALRPATKLPDTFETPPRRQRCSTGTSRIRSPAAAARICISRFQP